MSDDRGCAIRNNCKNHKLLNGWAEKAWGYQVVFTTSSSRIDSNDGSNMAHRVLQSPTFLESDIEKTEGLFVGFDTFGGDSMDALILTDLELVLLFCNYEGGWEYYGELKHNEFWEYLDSFPNIKKYVKI